MELSTDIIRTVVEVVQFIMTLVIGVYVWLTNRHKANKDAIDTVDAVNKASIKEVGARVDALSDRVLELETSVAHMPDHQALGDLHKKINEVSNSVSKIEGQMSQMNVTLTLIQRALMDDKE